jgi:hypothetical protein
MRSLSRRVLGVEYFRKIVDIFSHVMDEDQKLGRPDQFESRLVD